MKSGMLMAVHGFLGSSRDWDAVTVPGWETVTWELPGHGKRADEPLCASFEQAASGLIQAIERLSRPRVLMGYSMGARVALAAAVSSPGCIDGLILESGRVGMAAEAERAARRAVDAERAAALRREGSEAFLTAWYQQPLFATLAGDPELLEARIATRKAHPASAWAAALEVLGTGQQPCFSGSLGRIRVPVLLLAGVRDAAYVAHAREMAEDLKTAKVEIIPGAGHDVHSERPDVFCESLRRFFEANFPE